MNLDHLNTSAYLNYQISYLNREEFADLKREIFTYQLYYFETDSPTPVIIDAGAHIGLATLYFKNIYPQAQILAFEANPLTFQILQQNLRQNHLDQDVQAFNVALSKHNGQVTFYHDVTTWQWLSTSSLIENAWNGQQKTVGETVSSARLDQYLSPLSKIDLLKMDIEGAESTVLLSIRDQFQKIQEIIFEFHPTKNQKLDQLLSFLEKRGFTCVLTDRQNRPLKAYHHQELIIVHAIKN